METSKQNNRSPEGLGELSQPGKHNKKIDPYVRNGFLGTKEIQQIRKDKGYKLSFEK